MDFYRRFMAFAAEVTPDNQGRVVIPQKLRSYAGLTTDVVVTGRGERAEIWAKARWTDTYDQPDEPNPDDSDMATDFADLRIYTGRAAMRERGAPYGEKPVVPQSL